MQTNKKRPKTPAPRTHGGTVAVRTGKVQELRRSVMSSMLWEDNFYEDGKSHAERVAQLVNEVPLDQAVSIAIEARNEHNLRHVPLHILASCVKKASGTNAISEALPRVINRADELAEFLSMYWSKGRTPIAKQVKMGLAKAFQKFDAYQLAKYNRDGKAVSLRDVLFMVHPKPKDEAQAETWKQLAADTLPAPDTWEVSLSAGANKKETFERLLREGKLGYFALLRNLRNMEQTGVDRQLVREAILARKNGAEKILPFRFTAAARAAPSFERELDQALIASLNEMPAFSGSTAVVVDVSSSMWAKLSGKSDLSRMDAAATLAAIFPGDDVRMFSFSGKVLEVPARKGMAGVEAITKSQGCSGTDLAKAVAHINAMKFDRVIVITDEQSTSFHRVPDPTAKHAYMINVASYQNGVGYGKWTHIDGFSENVLRWIKAYEEL